MARRPLSAAELAQRRAAAQKAGRPSDPVSVRGLSRLARERAAVARARGIVRTVQEEVARTLIQGMRGTLPGSTAQSMIVAAQALASKGGLHDMVVQKNIGSETPAVNVRIGVDMKDYPPATESPDRAEDGSPLAH